MACLRICYTVVLSLLLSVAAALAQGQPPAATLGLYDRPVLVADLGMHTSQIRGTSADAAGHWAVTGSYDKTVRVWSLIDGELLRTIRLPAGPGNVGKAYAVAMSPDGTLIAVGGWLRFTSADPQEQIYLYARESGALVRRIEGLPDGVDQLVFSPDRRFLAATVGSGGLRIYGRDWNWAEVARDEDYGDYSFGADFAPDGRLATTDFDGKVRLYAGDLRGNLRPTAVIVTPGGHRPYGIAFSPDGSRLVVGYNDSTAVDLLDGRTLARLPRPSLAPKDSTYGNRDLAYVGWSRDGRTVFAAGRYEANGRHAVLAWSDGGTGAQRILPAGQDTVMSLIPLPGGDLLVAAQDPWLARLSADGSTRWVHGPPQALFFDQYATLSVSSDGTLVAFGFFADFGEEPARFDLASRLLTLGPPSDKRMVTPRQDGLPVGGWHDTTHPTLNGRPLRLLPYETSRSLAISPTGDRFVLGAEWTLRAFDAKGTPLWTRLVPGPAWAVNITGDGRLVIAAYGDGTIRWHRMSDGVELLAFMPLPDKTNWVAWTPEGFYAATAGAHGILRWHVNRGWDAPADIVPVENIPGSYRPAVLPLVLQELETPRALGLAVLAEHNHEVKVRTNSRLPPSVKLDLLAIGIDAYKEDYAKSLRLKFADSDAHDLASAIVNTQGSLYAAVKPQVLLDENATREGILRALDTMQKEMANGTGNDLAVVHFSGHGALVGHKLYLMPYEADPRDSVGIKNTGLPISELRDELLELAQHNRVLVLLDACHSGATAADGTAIEMDSTTLRTELAASNVTVITSSSSNQLSREDPAWEHGAFTKVLLDAFNDPAADINRNHLISPNGLGNYVTTRVESLTAGAQTPGFEIRYDTTVFAAGM